MNDPINQHLRQDRDHGSGSAIVCADGLALRVSAGERAFCTPRTAVGPYLEVEVTLERGQDVDLLPYAETAESFPNCVFMFVPITHLARLIERHGGLRTVGRGAPDSPFKPVRA